MSLSVPIRIQGHDSDGTPFEELTTSHEASLGGLSFKIQHPVEPGQVLLLSVPLPKRFRRYDYADATYRIYALVRDVSGADPARVGVYFLGRTPPHDYLDNPGGRYLLPNDPPPAPKERRQHTRLPVYLNLRLERENAMNGATEEVTVAENLGQRGAQVLTTLPVQKGEIVKLQEVGGDFRTRAEIKNVHIGKDQIPRLNLMFLDAEPPPRLISTS